MFRNTSSCWSAVFLIKFLKLFKKAAIWQYKWAYNLPFFEAHQFFRFNHKGQELSGQRLSGGSSGQRELLWCQSKESAPEVILVVENEELIKFWVVAKLWFCEFVISNVWCFIFWSFFFQTKCRISMQVCLSIS